MSPLSRGERDLPCSLSASKHCTQGQEECGRREPCCPIWSGYEQALRSSPSSPASWLWGFGRVCLHL